MKPNGERWFSIFIIILTTVPPIGSKRIHMIPTDVADKDVHLGAARESGMGALVIEKSTQSRPFALIHSPAHDNQAP